MKGACVSLEGKRERLGNSPWAMYRAGRGGTSSKGKIRCTLGASLFPYPKRLPLMAVKEPLSKLIVGGLGS